MSITLSLDELKKIIDFTQLRGTPELNENNNTNLNISKKPIKIVFSGVEFDSRNVKGGELFIALKGEQMHGHAFVEKAFDNGASLAMVEDGTIETSFPERTIVVQDTLIAFAKVANWWRRKVGIPIVAVTGSVGKTTTKELIASILMEHSPGAYSQKSYNNHVGVPYTLCKIDLLHKWAVVEIGMNHSGEIEKLVKIVEPECAVITKIAPSHIEHFNSINEIAQAKLEIIDGIKSGGHIIINGNDPILIEEFFSKKIKDKIKSQRIKLSTFGIPEDKVDKYHVGDLNLEITQIVSKLLDGLSLKLKFHAVEFKELQSAHSSDELKSNTGNYLSKESKIDVKIIGRHNAINIAAAVLSSKILLKDLTFEEIVKGLSRFSSPLMRLNVILHTEEKFIIDDSYNANPESMIAFLNVARDFLSTGSNVGIIIGDMLELGAYSKEAHLNIGQLLIQIQPSFCICIGEMAHHIYKAIMHSEIPSYYAHTVHEGADIVKDLSWDFLFIKASRKMELNKTIDLIKVK